jgi:surfactin synthase thioesterase subunit
MQLLCVPFAGAGASFYHAWSKLGVSGLDIRPVQLPGRERRIADDPFTDLHEAADALAPELLAGAGGQPVAVFGHCFMGSVLAYELTRRLLARAEGSVCHLFVSASRCPAVSRRLDSARLPDDAFVDMVQSVTGYQHPAFAIPEMRELLLPTLRADFHMDESYAPRAADKLPVPITAAFATSDAAATRDQVAEWQSYTAGGFDLVQYEGGHMYLADDPLPLLQMISKKLAP